MNRYNQKLRGLRGLRSTGISDKPVEIARSNIGEAAAKREKEEREAREREANAAKQQAAKEREAEEQKRAELDDAARSSERARAGSVFQGFSRSFTGAAEAASRLTGMMNGTISNSALSSGTLNSRIRLPNVDRGDMLLPGERIVSANNVANSAPTQSYAVDSLSAELTRRLQPNYSDMQFGGGVAIHFTPAGRNGAHAMNVELNCAQQQLRLEETRRLEARVTYEMLEDSHGDGGVGRVTELLGSRLNAFSGRLDAVRIINFGARVERQSLINSREHLFVATPDYNHVIVSGLGDAGKLLQMAARGAVANMRSRALDIARRGRTHWRTIDTFTISVGDSEHWVVVQGNPESAISGSGTPMSGILVVVDRLAENVVYTANWGSSPEATIASALGNALLQIKTALAEG